MDRHSQKKRDSLLPPHQWIGMIPSTTAQSGADLSWRQCSMLERGRGGEPSVFQPVMRLCGCSLWCRTSYDAAEVWGSRCMEATKMCWSDNFCHTAHNEMWLMNRKLLKIPVHQCKYDIGDWKRRGHYIVKRPAEVGNIKWYSITFQNVKQIISFVAVPGMLPTER